MQALAFIVMGVGLAGCHTLAQATTNTTPALTKEADEKAGRKAGQKGPLWI